MSKTSDANGFDSLLDELASCERKVWQALVQGDQHADTQLLSDEFLGVYPSGFATKKDYVNQLDRGPTIAKYDLSDLRAMRLGNDHAVLSYKAQFVRAGERVQETMWISSIWARAEDGWINVFNQDTKDSV